MPARKHPSATVAGQPVAAILAEMAALGTPENIAGMARFGICPSQALGLTMPQITSFAKRLGRNPALADALWATGVQEARLLACYVADPKTITVDTLSRWASQMDNWALCDNLCTHLARKTPHAWALVELWSRQQPEFICRAGFSLLAFLAVHDKKAPDTIWPQWLQLAEVHAIDERNFVKKAVCWAIRQIGKRNPHCRKLALATAHRLAQHPASAARWSGKAALRELQSL